MRRRRLVIVPQYWVNRCHDYSDRIIKWYASDEGRRVRSGNRGTEKDPKRQGRGKLGEAAVALYFGLDPEHAVKWTTERADSGADVMLPCDLLADVKTTFPQYNLIWSNTVNDLYARKEFHVIVSVSVEEADWHHCWIDGFIDKGAFLLSKRIANGYGKPRLEPGTWWLPKSELNDIEELMTW